MNLLIIKIISNLIIIPIILMLAWNMLIPELLSLSKITYFDAVILKVISNILFKNYQTEKDKSNEEEEIKRDLLKLETFIEKYAERIKNIKYQKEEKKNE